MTSHKRPLDPEAAAVQEFKDEGVFLFTADRAADTLKRRLAQAHSSVRTFHLTRDELEQIADQFARAVAIASEYHLGAADFAA